MTFRGPSNWDWFLVTGRLILSTMCPNSLGKDRDKFRNALQLQNGYVVQSHLAAQNIVTFCIQSIQENWT
jgi:hypothetical protein